MDILDSGVDSPIRDLRLSVNRQKRCVMRAVLILGLLMLLANLGCSSTRERVSKILNPEIEVEEQSEMTSEVGRLARGNRKADKEPADFIDSLRDPRALDIERNVGVSH